MSIYPINFSIHSSKICDPDTLHKTKLLAHIIPGDNVTYIFDNESDYYNDYKISYFGLTCKKGGWDCLRHYEILACGCIPLFHDLENCPVNILPFFPKKIILETNRLYWDILSKCDDPMRMAKDMNLMDNYIRPLIEYTRKYLTNDKISKYILDITGHSHVKNILFLSENVDPDYLRCNVLAGFKYLFGTECHDFPKVRHIYNNYSIQVVDELYGKGFTYSRILDEDKRCQIYDDSLEEDIKNKKYDLVIYGSLHKGLPYWEFIKKKYDRNDIILLCGDDTHICCWNDHVHYGFTAFVRELDYCFNILPDVLNSCDHEINTENGIFTSNNLYDDFVNKIDQYCNKIDQYCNKMSDEKNGILSIHMNTSIPKIEKNKTLVIILSETRAHELTFDNFKKNVIDELDADLCVCIGVKPDYDYSNPYYQLAKHRFLYDEPSDFSEAFDYAYDILCKHRTKYEKIENINTISGKLSSYTDYTNNIHLLGNYNPHHFNINQINYDLDEIVIYNENFSDKNWKNRIYGVRKSDEKTFFEQENVITYKKPLHWRNFMKLNDQFMGGVHPKNGEFYHRGSGGILIFFRWFLLKNLIDNDIINQYDRFIITRSDFLYQLPHPKMSHFHENCIWIPDSEHYDGYTDRHAILSRKNIIPYLNIFNNFVLKSSNYFMKMEKQSLWNLEKVIKFHLEQNNVLHLVREFPYIMYSVRNVNGSTKWAEGEFSDDHGYYIKYKSEFEKSSYYKKLYDDSGLSVDSFYHDQIKYN